MEKDEGRGTKMDNGETISKLKEERDESGGGSSGETAPESVM